MEERILAGLLVVLSLPLAMIMMHLLMNSVSVHGICLKVVSILKLFSALMIK